ncbi:MAG TPA: glycosyltransferase family 4 protein [Blastocatellia bacterium]|nr:glycosyltransferase family 4 protein [Blastocatellia bacterium]
MSIMKRGQLQDQGASATSHASRITHHVSRITHHASPIRVVRIIDRLNVGGPAKHVVWLTEGLRGGEFETTLITGTVPPGEGDMSYFAQAAGVEPIVVREMSRELSPRDVVVIARLLRQLWELKPQIIHTHKSKAGAAGRAAAMLYKWLTPSALWLRPRRCRVVHTYHGHIFHSYYGPAKTRLFLAIERTLARLCTDRIITISEQQRREISGFLRLKDAGIFRVIPLGLDLDEAPDRPGALRRELRIGDDEILIGSVGRLCEVKNYALLLEAAAHLFADTTAPPVRFVVIGDGHLRAELERRAHKLGLSGKVLFTGFREDVMSLYCDMDIVALTSLNEGTPLTLIEAMNRGRAIAATEVGGVPDIMGTRRASTDGFSVWEHGVTARSGDPQGVARALRFLMERPELRARMGGRGRAFVRAHLSRDRLISDMQRLYRDLL